MRASNSSVAQRVRARESGTAPAGSAAISRAAFKPWVSTPSGATTMLAMPNSLACVALSGCPMTRNSNARRWPIRRGASRLEAASGIRLRLTRCDLTRRLQALGIDALRRDYDVSDAELLGLRRVERVPHDQELERAALAHQARRRGLDCESPWRALVHRDHLQGPSAAAAVFPQSPLRLTQR